MPLYHGQEEKHNYGSDQWRAPKPEANEVVIYSEHGRDLNWGGHHSDNTCHCAFWHMVVMSGNRYFLLTKHGGGEERHHLSWAETFVKSLAALESDALFFLLDTIYHFGQDRERKGAAGMEQKYREAFAEGRLTKRKIRGQNKYRIILKETYKGTTYLKEA